MSAKRLEEGLGLAPGQLPQSLVDGKELVLVLVSFPQGSMESPELFDYTLDWQRALASRLVFADVCSS